MWSGVVLWVNIKPVNLEINVLYNAYSNNEVLCLFQKNILRRQTTCYGLITNNKTESPKETFEVTSMFK